MPEVERQNSWRGVGLFLLIAACVVALDQITKMWVRSNIPLYKLVPVFGCLSLTDVRNTGSAFGLFANQVFLLTLVAVIGLVAILLIYRHLAQISLLSSFALGLVFGGAVGNLMDRVVFGYVTDFILVRVWGDFYWPSFNVADSGITVGAIALIVFLFWALRKGDVGSSGARGQKTAGH